MKPLTVSIILLLLLSVSGAYAQNSHIRLLAISEDSDIEIGQVADLYLEIVPGQGRIFIDSYPLTHTDTQVSTRFANRYACDYVQVDCSSVDFIYTIQSSSPSIQGPSASAAIAVLTIARLKDVQLDDRIALTGTLNSGGLIGAVGGVREKIQAAHAEGLSMVLVPRVSSLDTPLENESLNASGQGAATYVNWTAYGKKQGIEVKEVATIADVLDVFGIPAKDAKHASLAIDPYYRKTMRTLAEDLCNQTVTLSLTLHAENNTEEADTLRRRGVLFLEEGKLYSGASQCFAALTRYRYHELRTMNLTNASFDAMREERYHEIDAFLLPPYQTMMDLQAYAMVKERLLDARETLDEAKEQERDDALFSLAYAIERINTAHAWSTFITQHGEVLDLDPVQVQNVCFEKIQEAQELLQYVGIYLQDTSTLLAKQSLDQARTDYQNGDHELCIFKATKAKAESNLILSSVGLQSQDLASGLELKFDAIEEIMSSRSSSFPIVGYSYYEYAKALHDVNDSQSAFLYAEYALELSTMDRYFTKGRKKAPPSFEQKTPYDPRLIFGLGVLFGTLLFWSVERAMLKTKNTKRKDAGVRTKKARRS